MRTAPRDYHSLSFEDFLAYVERLGGAVERGHHGGEVRISHPLARRRLVLRSNRKDIGRATVGWLRQIEKRLAALREVLGVEPPRDHM